MIDFPRTVRKILIDKKMQNYQLGELIKMSPSMLSQFLARKDYRINADIIRIAGALGYDVQLTLIDRETGHRIDCD
jgi:transcriptional regulator with XRE-family HTH domain